ncbi:Dynamin-related protein 3A [Dendrobium catenatum]|uniref:Dynamin-related protein 3A n=1 Tax=Dendrobium catenatum TaxID=906689 RepID=A0A2I0WKG0_9ASPA|nr:Dynamin-related protein 3A [Dendrobium catenatum]
MEEEIGLEGLRPVLPWVDQPIRGGLDGIGRRSRRWSLRIGKKRRRRRRRSGLELVRGRGPELEAFISRFIDTIRNLETTTVHMMDRQLTFDAVRRLGTRHYRNVLIFLSFFMISEILKGKAGQGVKLLNILTKYCEAFTSMIEGKNEELSTAELSGGARIHYIFQTIFVKSLEEVDPCEDVSDEDIRMAIQNATGPRSALFVPEVPFEVLVRRQIGRLLDPSLQCAKFIYDELIKMSHHSLANELHRYPVLRKCMDEVIGNFLREGLQPAETMITHQIEMEMDYINTSHPNFVGGSKAVEIAQQQVKASRLAASVSRPKGARPVSDSDRPGSAGSSSGSGPSWGISSIFGVSENRAPAKEISSNKSLTVPSHNVEHSLSMIQLREPPAILKPSESQSEQEALEIFITKLLLKSYYDIVRKNIEDSVPKAIMHFLVNHTKRELHNVFIRKLYRENLFDDMLREPDDIAAKRKRVRETLRVLQQAYKTLDELPLEADNVEKGYSLDSDATGLPKVQGLPSSFYSASNDFNSPYTASPKNQRSRRSTHSGEQLSSMYPSSDANGLGSYPSVEA